MDWKALASAAAKILIGAFIGGFLTVFVHEDWHGALRLSGFAAGMWWARADIRKARG